MRRYMKADCFHGNHHLHLVVAVEGRPHPKARSIVFEAMVGGEHYAVREDSLTAVPMDKLMEFLEMVLPDDQEFIQGLSDALSQMLPLKRGDIVTAEFIHRLVEKLHSDWTT